MDTSREGPTGDRALPLRERKKLRTRRALAEAALDLFNAQGYVETTLDELVDHVEVSKRTFFRMYRSKEEVALAAEGELWSAYAERLAEHDIDGSVLTALRNALVEALGGLDPGWQKRFIRTRGLIAHTPALQDRSVMLSMGAQTHIVHVLEEKLGIDSRRDVRLRLAGEIAMGAWRCAARNWVAGRGSGGRRASGGTTALIRRVEEAFDAIPGALELTA